MDHHHEYGASCEHHEAMCADLAQLREEVHYLFAMLHLDVLNMSEHIEAVEEEERASNEEEASSPEESDESESDHEEEAASGEESDAAAEDEVVIDADPGLPDLPSEEEHRSHSLPMSR